MVKKKGGLTFTLHLPLPKARYYMEDQTFLKTLLARVISRHATPEGYSWLQQKANDIAEEHNSTAVLNASFAMVPRKMGNQKILLNKKESEDLQTAKPVLYIHDWSLDRLSRVWLLMHVDANDKECYHTKIETLFTTAAMNELVALYSALPVLQYSQMWRHRCTEGIRSNIGSVLEAIMCNNTYPAQYLDEKAWNQLVLKAFFTEKPVHQIVGLDERRNKELAYVLSDFAHERWAAGREVPLQIWRCVVPFVDEKLFADIVRLAQSQIGEEKRAAVLVCRQSTYAPCKDLLKSDVLQMFAGNDRLSWQTLAEQKKAVV